MAFAFILYDFKNPQISKVLHDPNYWRALNDISGRYLSVFSLHHSPDEQQGEVRTAGWAGPGNATRILLLKHFGITPPVPMPSLLFFQVSNEKVTGTYLVKLHATRIEDSFIEIADVLTAAATSISQVKDENRENTDEIFTLIETELQQRHMLSSLIRIGARIKSIVDIGTWLRSHS